MENKNLIWIVIILVVLGFIWWRVNQPTYVLDPEFTSDYGYYSDDYSDVYSDQYYNEYADDIYYNEYFDEYYDESVY